MSSFIYKYRNLLVIICLVSVGFNVYQWQLTPRQSVDHQLVPKTQVDSVEEIKSKLLKELDLVRDELSRYNGINKELDSVLLQSFREIKNKEKDIIWLVAKDKNNNIIIKELSAELEFVKQIKDRYFNQVTKLSGENKGLKETLAETSQKILHYDALASELSELTVQNLKVATYKGTPENRTLTTRGKNVRIIETCFSIAENKFAKAGTLNIYTRIINQKGVIVGQRGYFTDNSGTGAIQLSYSSVNEVKYANKEVFTCLNHYNDVVFESGSYTLELYINNRLAKRIAFSI